MNLIRNSFINSKNIDFVQKDMLCTNCMLCRKQCFFHNSKDNEEGHIVWDQVQQHAKPIHCMSTQCQSLAIRFNCSPAYLLNEWRALTPASYCHNMNANMKSTELNDKQPRNMKCRCTHWIIIIRRTSSAKHTTFLYITAA